VITYITHDSAEKSPPIRESQQANYITRGSAHFNEAQPKTS